MPAFAGSNPATPAKFPSIEKDPLSAKKTVYQINTRNQLRFELICERIFVIVNTCNCKSAFAGIFT